MSDAPPPDIERLLDEHIASVGTLELLLHLRDGQGRQVGDICRVLGSPRSWTEVQLEALARGGLVAGDREGGWSYAPATSRLAATVDSLARAWGHDPQRVNRWIFRRRPGRRRRR